MAKSNNITMCSFCGKSHAEVRKLISGPGVYICDNCVILCKNVLDKELFTEAKKTELPELKVPKPAEIKRHLDAVGLVGEEQEQVLQSTAFHVSGRSSVR